MTRRPVALLLACLVALSARGALAQSGADEARRTKLFQEGKRLADEGRWSEAVVPLREVVVIRSAPKALIALAVVERQLMRFVEAHALLERAEAEAKAGSLAEDAQAARAALDDLDKVIPRVVLQGDAADPSAEVFVDDRAPVRRGDELLLDPGEHVVRVELPRRAPHRERLSIAPGQVVKIAVAGVAPPPPSAPIAAGVATEGPSVMGPLTLGGSGIALAGAGLAFMIIGWNNQVDAENECGGTVGCSPTLQDLVDDGATKIVVGDVLLGVGGAAALGGAIWLVVELTREPGSELGAFRPDPRGISIAF
ncbi:MAG: hypothetical protein JNL21_37585 [Myxococcales bacterium]|nr:hypothetical protein [Myxococcales bacterium]